MQILGTNTLKPRIELTRPRLSLRGNHHLVDGFGGRFERDIALKHQRVAPELERVAMGGIADVRDGQHVLPRCYPRNAKNALFIRHLAPHDLLILKQSHVSPDQRLAARSIRNKPTKGYILGGCKRGEH